MHPIRTRMRRSLVRATAAQLSPLCDLHWTEPPDRLIALRPDPADVALFLLSGGTTGLPKLIPRTHNDYEYNSRGSGAVCAIGADTVYLTVLPISHNFPLASPG